MTALAPVPLADRHAAYREELVSARMLFPMGEPGMYGKSATYERVFDALGELITRRGADLNAFRVRFPPLLPFATYEKTDYIASFPNLAGAITGFEGDDLDHADLLARRIDGEDWRSSLTPADMMLVPAACHPLYEQLVGTLPEGGIYADVLGYCYRREPSIDPFRMQSFRMREYVYVGDPETAKAHRDTWAERGLQMLSDLGLDPRSVPATDPFFGRAGNMLATNQLEHNLKTELVLAPYGLDEETGDGTAVMSANYHVDHFGEAFGITTPDGAVAHSACTGIGVDRIVLGILRVHGFEPDSWPAAVRNTLFGDAA